eukprot:CAMPEP_0172518784 /NCGR_PEP_ID=MMETSP1066-20121228/291022_1 /TAXON_ID=671091 /ORGANISM="Coscinodiscus wailesii, Strain CCMP2513" /LENGTH=216 /DNA_ID=CAMNT_0013301231 /DNA_START=26 /DNA_END=676 /DNA_ORIENTATION=+
MSSEPRSLPDPPSDGITSISYLPNQQSNSSILAATSWDGGLRVYDTTAMTSVVARNMESGPLMSLAASKDGSVYTGGLDGSVRKFDITTNKPTLVGKHAGKKDATSGQNCVSCLSPLSPPLVASASWDGRVHVWDVRCSSSSTPASSFDLPGKAFSMDSCDEKLVVATAGRRTVLLDVRRDGEVVEVEEVMERESSLKYQTRVVRFFPNGTWNRAR